ncbi:DUF86 domain-containing protein [Candidatus Bathyarchaeota archaeon]|nr:MAG: DUF86 domain-containing protein [Candidatus Bathyarchaeota archaeon]
MEKEREKRYRQKIDGLIDRLEFIEENFPASAEELKENRIIRKSLYKEFQEIAEIISDIAAMVTKDNKKTVEDDYSNIEKLCKALKLDKTLCSTLKRANGLRNVLIHEYNGINDDLAYESISEILPYLKLFANKIIEWLEKNF